MKAVSSVGRYTFATLRYNLEVPGRLVVALNWNLFMPLFHIERGVRDNLPVLTLTLPY